VTKDEKKRNRQAAKFDPFAWSKIARDARFTPPRTPEQAEAFCISPETFEAVREAYRRR